MPVKKGITLIECLLYLTFIVWLVSASTILVTRLWNSCLSLGKIEHSALTVYSAYDLLLRDIQEAPSERSAWKKIVPTALIWHTNGQDIGWLLQKKGLVRIQGTFNDDTWQKKHTNLIAPVNTVHFSCEGTPIHTVHIKFGDEYSTIQESLMLCNRTYQ